MNTGVADRFLDVFTRYIDSGFGLLGGEVAFLASTLVVIDVTLAALFWSWSAGDDILARLIKKTLYVGFFAFLLSNFNSLARVIFQSFSGLGLKAAGSGMSASDFLRPGKLAQSGIDAGKPILESAMQMCGFPQFFDNFPQIAVLMVAWLIVLVAFFVLAVQLFVTLIEFKLTTLAGFVLVPFGLFGKTAFLAERVLGNVVASGVKVLVLAVIVGIGSTLFGEFIHDFGGQEPTLEEVLSLALASLCLLGLGIFGPAIANGLVSGAPQLGAGAAVGTALAAGGLGAAGAMGARAAVAAGAGGVRGVVTAMRSARPGPTGSGDGGFSPPRPPGPGGPAGSPSGGSPSGGSPSSGSPSSGAPAWARQYQRRQEAAHGAATAAHALRSGDHPGGGTSVSLAEDRS
jgi:type IV secretion system protein TrbL